MVTPSMTNLVPGVTIGNSVAGQECGDDVAKKNTSLGDELTGGRIEGHHPVEVMSG